MEMMKYNSLEYRPIFIGKSALEAACKINSADLIKLKVENSAEGLDLLEIVTKLHEKWRISRKALGDGDDVDAQAIELEFRQEKLLNERIKNQLRLGVLIPKPEAQNRMLKLLIKYREFIQIFIRAVAKDQVLSKIVMKPTVRAWEEYLTLKYNDLATVIEKDEMEIKDWETDGSAKLLQTRLNATDKDIDELILNQGTITA